jgi:hypothetical protein
MATRSRVFVSYSHRDAEWLTRLQVHLAPLVRDGVIDFWDDTRIKAGGLWRKEIQKALDETRVAILLISADFMASDFIASEELPPLLVAAENEGITILPVILSASLFEETAGLRDLQTVNPPSRPVIGMAKVDQEALFELISRTVVELVTTPDTEVAAIGGGRAGSSTVSEPGPGAAGTSDAARSSLNELQDRVKITQQLVAKFSPERYWYMSLIGIFGLVTLLSAGTLLFGEPGALSQQVTLTSVTLGAGGATLFSCGQLFKIRTRTFEFIRELTTTVGETT